MDTSEFTDEQIEALQALADGYNDQSVSRRDVMKLVGAGGVGALLGGGGAASAVDRASAGTAQSGQLGAVGDPLDLVVEDLKDGQGNTVASANAGALEGTDLQYESVNAEEVGNTFWAVGYDGATGDVKLQAAIDDAAAVDGAAAVIVTGEPDDLSDYAEASRNSGWLISSTIQHKSDVHIHCIGDPYFFLDDNIDSWLIENADHSVSGDSNLKLIGGTWDANQATNDARGSDGENGNLLYYPVDDIEISPRKVMNYGPSVFAVQVGDGSNWKFGDIEFEGDKDGLKLHGPASHIRAGKLHGDAGDDMVAISSADFPSVEISTGEIDDVHIEQVGEEGATYDGGGLAFVGNSSNLIKNVTVDSIFGGDVDTIVTSYDDGTITGDGKTSTENIEFHIKAWNETDGSGRVANLKGSTHTSVTMSIQLSGVDVPILVDLGADTFGEVVVEDLQVHNCPTISQAILVQGHVDTLKILHANMWNSNSALIKVNGAGRTADRIIVENLTYIGPGGAGGAGTGGNIINLGAGTPTTLISDSVIDYGGVITYCHSTTDKLKIVNSEITNSDRLADNDNTTEMQLTNVEGDAFVNDPFYIRDGATVDVRAENFKSDYAGTMFGTATATFTTQVDGRDIQVDVDDLTPRANDRAYNTDSTKDYGTGVVYSPDGTTWVREAVVTESANAETPQGTYGDGQLVDFTDSGDGSGDGLYIIGSSGSPQGPV